MKDNAGYQSASSVEESNSTAAQRPTDEDLHALSHLAEQLNSKLAGGINQFEALEEAGSPSAVVHPAAADNVDLDNLFAFLSEIHGDTNKNPVLEELEMQMNELATDLDLEIQEASDVRYFHHIYTRHLSSSSSL